MIISTKHQMILAKQCSSITSVLNGTTKPMIARSVARLVTDNDITRIRSVELTIMALPDSWFEQLKRDCWRFLNK